MNWPCCLGGKLKDLPRWEEPVAGDSASRYVWELWWWQDATGWIFREYSRALFITMTANGAAVEVTSLLKDGQLPEDRWDLCSDVFDAHRRQLIHEIDAEGIFGASVARFSVVEFQKRGLPHLHLLLWLFEQPTDAGAIDEIVSAMIPPVGKLRRASMKK
eukprot:COSAG02_NODE_742_length_17794_cov_22.222718_10_plen_160_part_00